jgi:ADP-ribosylglycohydrolase
MKVDRTKVLGGLYGLLVGDALGVPYEFHAAREIPAASLIEYTPPKGFRRAHQGTPSGTWSDDGAQALVLLDSLLAMKRLDVRDFARHLLAWADTGYMAVDGRVFDIGSQTSEAMHRIRHGGRVVVNDGPEFRCGNGSLMRTLPLALWHNGTDADLVRDAHRQSAVTHGQTIGQVSCALYALWARRTLLGRLDAWEDATKALRNLYRSDAVRIRELNEVLQPDSNPKGNGSGYVVDCLHSARLALKRGKTYEDVVREAILIGADTDTTACVAGGIAGIRYGLTGIPARWIDGLRGRHIVGRVADRLITHLHP